MPLTDKVLRFLVNRIPIKTLKSELRRLIFMKYNFYGNENKAVYSTSGENILWSMKGLRITVEGNNNLIIFGQNIKFKNTRINISGNHNFITIADETKFTDSQIEIDGNNNKINIANNLIFESTLLSMCGYKNLFVIKPTKHKIRDAKLYISDSGRLYIDKNSQLKNRGLYIVVSNSYKKRNKLVIGKNVFIAKDAIIRTSDGHTLVDPVTGLATNEPQDIIIGNNVWIASRCIILKGSYIPDNSMVAAGSLVNKKFKDTNIMLAGTPAKIIRKNIIWDVRGYGKYMRDFEGNKNV